MKKQLFAIVMFALSALIATAQNKQNDLSVYNLKGNVKSVVETTYEAVEKFGELEKGKKTAKEVNVFNKAGYILEQEIDFIEDEEKYSEKTKYDDRNNAIEIKEDDDGYIQVYKIKYNAQGEQEVIDVYSENGKLENKQKNQFNSQGLLVQAVSYNGDGSLRKKVEHLYNAKGQLIEKTTIDKSGNKTELNVYAYDDNGNKTEDKSIDFKKKNPETIVWRYVYDRKKQKIEESNSITGLDRKNTFTYDDHGNMVKELDAYGGKVENVYTYDKQGNWIRRITNSLSFGTQKFEIVEREIKYY